MIRQWLETLCEEAVALIDDGYTVGPAMEKAWDSNYDSVVVSSCHEDFEVDELRSLFWDDGFETLEAYEELIIDKYNKFSCKECGWFTWYPQENGGFCNEHSIRRGLQDNCIEEDKDV